MRGSLVIQVGIIRRPCVCHTEEAGCEIQKQQNEIQSEFLKSSLSPSACQTSSPVIDPSLSVASNIILLDVQMNGPSAQVTEKDALTEMNQHSYEICDSISARLVSDTTTTIDYTRYVNNYDIWWNSSQAMEKQRNIVHTSIPSRPITAAKVAHFLNHEISHLKPF
ncbi:hypothetical protein M422DRAFT_52115 [Sphaerobolus stellatus SS14]|uniref:Uncharacterized protein n=1 Tax=Sphaerobolus stellatus (strain SS14) TaxID=990650 RepID=A0A0C9UXT3_SPHS4|nr:hypothetical protein M422DRAFT_52115 [Sphaerobolus stellatus SS14]